MRDTPAALPPNADVNMPIMPSPSISSPSSTASSPMTSPHPQPTSLHALVSEPESYVAQATPAQPSGASSPGGITDKRPGPKFRPHSPFNVRKKAQSLDCERYPCRRILLKTDYCHFFLPAKRGAVRDPRRQQSCLPGCDCPGSSRPMSQGPAALPVAPIEADLYLQYDRTGELVDSVQAVGQTRCFVSCLGYYTPQHGSYVSENFGRPPNY